MHQGSISGLAWSAGLADAEERVGVRAKTPLPIPRPTQLLLSAPIHVAQMCAHDLPPAPGSSA